VHGSHGLVEVRASWPRHPRLSKKKKKLEHTDILDAELDKFIPAKSHISQKQIDEAFGNRQGLSKSSNIRI
jgi:hypothetical protein